MKKIKWTIAAIIYILFSYLYARIPEIHISGGFSFEFNTFSAETFVMMIFIGAYLTAFWILINRLFRS